MILVRSKKASREKLLTEHPNAIIADVTSKGELALKKFSPFYPHGEIPIPFSDGHYSASVEGVWQGLKVFEGCGIDTSCFTNATMKNLKRTVRKFGKPLGHQMGINSTQLLDYLNARVFIYLPTYLWMLENKAQDLIQKLKEKSKDRVLILLDYDTNGDVLNVSKPISHAYLLKYFLEGCYPGTEVLSAETPPSILPADKASTQQSSSKLRTKNKKHSSSTKNSQGKLFDF